MVSDDKQQQGDICAAISEKQNTRFNPRYFLLVVAVAATLCFYGLGKRSLWQDEGETAVLAQSVLREGIPKALNKSSSNLVYQGVVSYDKAYRWTFHPWCQFYLAAAGLALLGNTEFAARLPFALCGVLTVALLYVFVWRHWRNSVIATLSALLLATSATFIIHCRQCRYYGLSALTCLIVVAVFIELMKRPYRRWWILWGLALALQFYTDFGTLLVMLPGLVISLWPLHGRRQQLTAAAKASLLAIALIMPALVLHWERLTRLSDVKYGFLRTVLVHLCYLDGWFIPLLLLLPAGGILIWQLLKDKQRLSEQDRGAVTCGYVLGSTMVGMAWAASYPHIRYIISQMSLAKLLLAVILMKAYAAMRSKGLTSLQAKAITTIAVVILIFTNITGLPMQTLVDLPDYKTHDFCSGSKPFLRTEFVGLLYELTHDFVCPNRITRNIADKLIETGETILINYGDLPLMFYRPDLKIRRLLRNPDMPAEQQPPDVIIIRPCFTNHQFEQYLQSMLKRDDYHVIKVPAPDMIWGNIPEPREHRFVTPLKQNFFIIYLRGDHKHRSAKLL